jgi:putative phosphoribosyl transferase
MYAAVLVCQKKKANHIIVAASVSSEQVAVEFEMIVDDVVILEKPVELYAVAQAYRHWHDVPDKEVITLLRNNENSLSLVRGISQDIHQSSY